MPLYAYSCSSCSAEFEALVRTSDTPVCLACGAETLTRLVSRIASEIKHTSIVRAGRQVAAAQGHFSNYSRAERKV